MSGAAIWAPKAKQATAAAVYGPIPGSFWSSPGSRGKPPRATTACAHRCRFTARRLYPGPLHARITSAGVAAASASTVGQRSSHSR